MHFRLLWHATTFEGLRNLKASAKVYNLDSTEKFSKTAILEAGPESSNKLFVLPEIQGVTPTYFLKLELEDSKGKVVSSNFYWLSKEPEVPDWAKSTWSYTPTKTFADLTGLMALPKVSLSVSSRTTHTEEGITSVTVANPTPRLAFFVRLRVTKGQKGAEVLPIFWEDNYFPLMPGAKRTISATYRLADLGGAVPSVALNGWNVLPQQGCQSGVSLPALTARRMGPAPEATLSRRRISS